MARYLVLFRSHYWDPGIAELAARARDCCPSGSFMVTMDETRGPVRVDDFVKLSHTDDFSQQGLPSLPEGRVLWWNADYVLYFAAALMPDFDYYVMVENDVFVDFDVDALIEACASRKVDLMVHDLKRISASSVWYSSISDMEPEPWWALIPFLVVSRRGVDLLRAKRLERYAHKQRTGSDAWPYCEAFIPTAIKQAGGVIAALGEHVDASMLRYRPRLSRRDPALKQTGIVAHPVHPDRHFIRNHLADTPLDEVVLSGGRLCTCLQREDVAALADVLRREVAIDERTRDLHLLPATKPGHAHGQTLIDLAHCKPARQSSRSRWSRGRTVEADAARAVRGILLDDYAFHTDHEQAPWWEVDLGADATITEVDIVNRTTIPNRLRRFRIDVSSDAATWRTAYRKVDDEPVSIDPERDFVAGMPPGLTARHVRIVADGPTMLHLRRVRVFGS